MNKYFLFVLFSVFSISQSIAQAKYELSGLLADKAEKTIVPFATVTLLDSATKAIKSNTFSDEKGEFVFDKILAGQYYITVKLTGYTNYTSQPFLVTAANVKLDTFYIEKSSKELKEIVVAASKPLLEVESDKLVYNVENDPTLQGLSAIEALKKLPFVTVDAEDNIQMKGSSNFKVLLNGKSTSIVAKNPSEALKAFPAILIKKIEVITEPSAKYDAEGTAGIINIITQKKVIGYNGSVNISYNTRGMNNGGGSFNLKQGKLGMSAYLGGNMYKYNQQITNELVRTTLSPGFENTLKQFSTNSSDGNWHWGNIELAYDFDTLHTLSFYASPNGGRNSNSSFQNSEIYSDFLPTDSFNTQNVNQSKNPSWDYGFDFIKVFKDNPDHELTFNIDRETRKDYSDYTSIQNFLTRADRDIFNTNKSKNTENTFRVDYSKPFKNKSSFETGTKFIMRNLLSDYQMLERSDPNENYYVNAANTNSMEYSQNVGSIYTVYLFPIKKFKVKIGGRVEQTWINANFNKDSLPIKTNYTNFIPSVSISQKIKKIHSLRLNYSKRIQRPWMMYLNPYVNNQNPKNISFGNPNLTPELTHNTSFSWNYFFKQNSLDLTLSHSFTDNVITSFTTVDTAGISYTTYYNIAKSNSLGINLSFYGMLFKKMQIWAGASTSYIQISHKLDASRNRSGFNVRGHGNATWNFKYGISATLGGGAFQQAPTLQSKRPLNYNYNLALKKAFLKKKLNVGIIANNFLDKKQTLVTTSSDPTFTSVATFSNLYFRYYSLSVSYNFGKLRENVSRKKGYLTTILKQEIKGTLHY